MKRNYFFIFFAICILQMQPVSTVNAGSVSSEKAACCMARPAEKISTLKKRALKGDAEAASILALYYNFTEFDNDERMFWHRLAAEYGSCADIFALSSYYRSLSKEKVKQWAIRAIRLPCDTVEEHADYYEKVVGKDWRSYIVKKKK